MPEDEFLWFVSMSHAQTYYNQFITMVKLTKLKGRPYNSDVLFQLEVFKGGKL
jgi:hypothetical protein